MKFIAYARRTLLIVFGSTTMLVMTPPMTLSSEAMTDASVIEVDVPISTSGINSEMVEVISPLDYIDKENVITMTPAIEKEVKEETEVIQPRISAEGPGELDYYHITEKEKIYIAKTVYKEARGESFEGQVAVAAVVLNRYTSEDPFFKNDSIYSVIMQKSQFAKGIMDVTEKQLAEYPDCMRAVEMALKGWDPTRKKFEEGAKYFFDPDLITSEYQKQIREGIEVLVIDNHYFHNELND